jgi:hypothetical protein
MINATANKAILNEMAAQMDEFALKKEKGALASQTEVAQRFNGAEENSSCPIAKSGSTLVT